MTRCAMILLLCSVVITSPSGFCMQMEKFPQEENPSRLQKTKFYDTKKIIEEQKKPHRPTLLQSRK